MSLFETKQDEKSRVQTQSMQSKKRSQHNSTVFRKDKSDISTSTDIFLDFKDKGSKLQNLQMKSIQHETSSADSVKSLKIEGMNNKRLI